MAKKMCVVSRRKDGFSNKERQKKPARCVAAACCSSVPLRVRSADQYKHDVHLCEHMCRFPAHLSGSRNAMSYRMFAEAEQTASRTSSESPWPFAICALAMDSLRMMSLRQPKKEKFCACGM